MADRDVAPAGSDDPPPGVEFEARVARLFQALGYGVVHNVRLGGQQIDLLVRRDDEEFGLSSAIVECKDWKAAVGAPEVRAFVHAVGVLRRGQIVTRGIMVSSNGFTADAKAAAAVEPDVHLVSIQQLEGSLLDVGAGAQMLVDDYEREEIFRDFIGLDATRLDWDDPVAQSVGEPLVDVLGVLRRAARGDGPSTTFLLADYGAGKTTLLRRLQYELCVDRLEGRRAPIPVLVRLSEYHDTRDVAAIVRGSLRDDFLRDVPPNLLWRGVRTGAFALLLDGFDEMLARSDADGRLRVFRELLPLLSSDCPCVLSSRPSVFVGRGELEEYIARAAGRVAPIRAMPQPHSRKEHQRFQPVEDLKERVLDLLPGGHMPAPDPLPRASKVAVLALAPLDDGQIRRFIEQRVASLRLKGLLADVETDEVVAFIERVYDLSDLATRPLLLEIILDAIALGGIEVRDESQVLGPSNLYDLYVSIKLDWDWRKGDVRRRALSRAQRLSFAEALAVDMHQGGVQDMVLEDVLGRLPQEVVSADGEPMTPAEIAADFFACSFIQIDEQHVTSFGHKSFLEFFVARTIKEELAGQGTLLLDPLSHQILYFIGGFAPKEPRVVNDLWSALGQTPVAARIARRNLLGAFLFTAPGHSDRVIRSVELFDLTYSRLRFDRGALGAVTWARAHIAELATVDAHWGDVHLVGCEIGAWAIDGSEAEVQVHDTDIGSLHIRDRSRAHLDVTDSTVRSVEVEGASLDLRLGHGAHATLTGRGCALDLATDSGSHLDIDLDGSHLTFAPGMEHSGQVRGPVSRSIIDLPGDSDPLIGIRASESLVRGGTGAVPHARRVADDCCWMTTAHLSRAVDLPDIDYCVIGLVLDGSALDLARTFGGWGVLRVPEERDSSVLPRRQPVSVAGRTVFCRPSWFDRAIGRSGPLSVVGWLRGAAGIDGGSAIGDLLAELRSQVDALCAAIEQGSPPGRRR